MKIQLLSIGVLVSLTLTHVVRAADSSQEAYDSLHQTGPNRLEGKDAVEVQAEVVKVNKKTREVTFKTESGENVTVKAGEEIRNFNQIKKGDTLNVRYMESLVLELKRKNKEPNGIVSSTDIVRAAPGQKPAGMVVDHFSAIGTITNVDKESQSVTVKGPRRTVTLHVKDQSILEELKKGDQIEAKYTEALAVSFENLKR